MSKYTHSMILFSGEDGLPMQFNIQSVSEKDEFKNLIEYGGGICTHGADAIFLVSPGTKVFNYSAKQRVISSRYILDCVEENYRLNINDYVVNITEVEASDFSEDSSLKMLEKTGEKSENDNSVDMLDEIKNVSPNELEYPKSNHAFDFGDTEAISNNSPKSVASVFPLQFYRAPENIVPPINTSKTSDELEISFDETIPSDKTQSKNMHISPTPPIIRNKDSHINQNKVIFSTSTERENINSFPNHELSLNTDELKDKSQISSTPENLISVDHSCITVDQVKATVAKASSHGFNVSPIKSSKNRELNVLSPSAKPTFAKENIFSETFQENDHLTMINKEKGICNIKSNLQSDLDINLPDSSEDLERSIINGQNFVAAEDIEIQFNCEAPPENHATDSKSSSEEINVVVTSSQPHVNDLDHFDEMIINKLQEKPKELHQEDEELSQNYTVSSSADAQVSSKPSPHDTSAEIFAGSAPIPDSPGLTTERQKYIKELEKEVAKILEKPSPKSIQDKIILVKYICIAKKLAPAIVLQTLQSF